MKRILITSILFIGVCLISQATPVSITTLDITQFPSYGDENVANGITNAINTWNLTHDPLPTTGINSTPDFKQTISENVLSLNLSLGGYNYLFLHWGGPNDDANYKDPELYYIGNDSGLATFNAPFNTAKDKQYGLSFYSLYSPKESTPTNSVPDASATVALLGVGLVSIAALNRKKIAA